MDPSFWINRWKDNQIGWQQESTNPLLIRYWDKLNLPPHSNVLVPCCGKSLDMIFLSKKNFNVTGIELSEEACSSFFEENKIPYVIEKKPLFKKFISSNITLYNGDLFDMTLQDFPKYAGIYDRAAIIALPQEMRARYAKHITSLSTVTPQTKMLLLSLEFDGKKRPPPPHSVSEKEIREIYSNFNIKPLYRKNIIDEEEKFKSCDIQTLEETIFLLEKI